MIFAWEKRAKAHLLFFLNVFDFEIFLCKNHFEFKCGVIGIQIQDVDTFISSLPTESEAKA